MGERKKNTFYHYCSNEAFCSIINNKSIRLSSLPLSNDKTEGRLVSRIFDALAADDPVRIDGFSAHIKELESRYHALGFCLSKKGDLLSQWRGYADNASGVSIGFSKKYLKKLAGQDELTGQGFSGQFSKVEYCLEKQKELLRPLYEAMKNAASRGGMGLPADNDELDASNELGALEKGPLATELYRVKDTRFSEEKEWRIIVPLREIDLAGYGCEYRVRDGVIVPYKNVDKQDFVIQEVVLGPKNLNSEQAVTGFLNSNGIWGVPVGKSDIPYC